MYLYSLRGKHLCTSCSWKMSKLFKTNAFFTHVLYFLSLSCLGFGILKTTKPRTEITPRNIDLFYTSVSAVTVSSMSAMEMEVFSIWQLVVLTMLMFVGGEVFTSMIRLHLKAMSFNGVEGKVGSPVSESSSSRHGLDQIELTSIVTVPNDSGSNPNNSSFLKYNSIIFLCVVVLFYLLAIQILGIALVAIYFALVSSAENVLRNKGINTLTFAVFSVVSTFANCGFIPTNENMAVFSKNSGLLLILIPQTLLGNTLFPSALRLFLWVLGVKLNRTEAKYLLKSSGREIGVGYLLPRLQCICIAATALGFILIGFIFFSSMEWNSGSLDGLNGYEKVVAILFLCANARHSGETVVDLSAIAPAILVFFILMMYLPPYTSFLPVENKEERLSKYEAEEEEKRRRTAVLENLVFSQLSYLAIFIILICITERKGLKEDPLNFTVLNITFEVISAYGNVGFTTGYSCDRQLRVDPKCVNKWIGFSGKWSDQGKIILILVMFFGRLKQFNMKGGRSWMLL